MPERRISYSEAYADLTSGDGRVHALWIRQNPHWQDATSDEELDARIAAQREAGPDTYDETEAA